MVAGLQRRRLMTVSATACRIVETGTAHSGQWNMACDEWLLESAIRGDGAAIRVYAWSRPTVSLGYFQQPDDLDDDPRLGGLDRVRRLSGGGAIVHHHEWTYSCAVASDNTVTSLGNRLYARIHQAIIDKISATTEHDISGLELRGSDLQDDQPALCFARASSDDVVCRGHKVLGSAQRRRRGAILQHGSLLLVRSPHAPEFPGLIDLLPELALPDDFPETIAHAIAESLEWRATLEPLGTTEQADVSQFAAEHVARLTKQPGS